MNLFSLICTVLLALLLLFILPRTIEEYRLHQSNSFVTVTVEQLPDCSSGYKHKFIHINHNGSTHILRTKCKYVKGLSVGQQLEMLHKPGTEIYLFKEEEVMSELVSVVLLALGLALCLVKSILQGKKLRTTSNFAKA